MSFIGRLSDSVRARFSETDSKSVPMLGFTEDERAKEISLGTAIVVDESSVNVAVALSLPEDTTHLRRKEDTCFALSQTPHSEVQRVHSRNAPSQWRPSSSARSPPGPPSQGLDSYGLLLTKLLGAGFDMKCRDDYTKSVLPVLQECGGSVQAIASSIDTNVSGGLSGPESFAARKAAYGHNRIPQKPMVSLCMFSSLFLPRTYPGSSLLSDPNTSMRSAGNVLATLSQRLSRPHTSRPQRRCHRVHNIGLCYPVRSKRVV
jgi:hypothetical protein